MPKSKRGKTAPKRALRLPDLEQTKSAVINSLTSKSGQRTYDHAITEFVDWYCSEPRLAFNRTVVLWYRIYLEQRHLAATTINLRLAAIRRVAYEAADSSLLSPELAAGIRRVKGVRRIGVRLGNWLTADQGRCLLSTARNPDLRSKRNYAILALLLGCGLRRGEVLALTLATIQLREEHWVIADLYGKAGHIRTVPIPSWVKTAIDSWTEASGIREGRLFRSINKAGRIWGNGMTPKVLWEIVKHAAKAAGIEKLAPHDLRRTCAKLCHVAGGELDQIHFFSDTYLSKLRNNTSGASKSCDSQSTTSSGSSHSFGRIRGRITVPWRLGRRIRSAVLLPSRRRPSPIRKLQIAIGPNVRLAHLEILQTSFDQRP